MIVYLYSEYVWKDSVSLIPLRSGLCIGQTKAKVSTNNYSTKFGTAFQPISTSRNSFGYMDMASASSDLMTKFK